MFCYCLSLITRMMSASILVSSPLHKKTNISIFKARCWWWLCLFGRADPHLRRLLSRNPLHEFHLLDEPEGPRCEEPASRAWESLQDLATVAEYGMRCDTACGGSHVQGARKRTAPLPPTLPRRVTPPCTSQPASQLVAMEASAHSLYLM